MELQESPRRPDWRTPTIIAGAVLSGTISAVSHHVFYQKLDGTPLDASGDLLSQQINIAIGTAFAFVFRASLTVAVSATYWQVFWCFLTRGKRNLALSQVDALAGILGSIFEFRKVQALLKNPTLVLFALLSWLIPWAALLPPATLGVMNVSHIEDVPVQIPVLNMSSNALVQRIMSPGGNWHSNAAGALLVRLATQAAFQGSIVASAAVGINTSYTTSFEAPILQCQEVEPDDLRRFERYMDDCQRYNYTRPGGFVRSCGFGGLGVSYLAWALEPPWDSTEGTKWPDWMPDLEYGDYGLIDRWSKPGPSYDYNNLFVATRESREAGSPGKAGNKPPGIWQLLNCSLHHATYSVVVSSSSTSNNNFSNLVVTPTRLIAEGYQYQEEFEEELPIENGAYAIMDCLIRVLAGHIIDIGTTTNDPIEFLSDISRTTLMFTKQLVYNTRLRHVEVEERLEAIENLSPADGIWPEEAFTASTFNQSLASGIEQLFQNMTLSLFSRSGFLRPTSQTTTAEVERWLNVYVYRQRNLLLSYGLALSLSLVVCTYGLAVIYRTGLSFSNQFSTVVRTTRGMLDEHDAVHGSTDQHGADPLPKHLASSWIKSVSGEMPSGRVESSRPGADAKQSAEASERSVMIERRQAQESRSSAHEIDIMSLQESQPYDSERANPQTAGVPWVRNEDGILTDWPTDDQWMQTANASSSRIARSTSSSGAATLRDT